MRASLTQEARDVRISRGWVFKTERQEKKYRLMSPWEKSMGHASKAPRVRPVLTPARSPHLRGSR